MTEFPHCCVEFRGSGATMRQRLADLRAGRLTVKATPEVPAEGTGKPEVLSEGSGKPLSALASGLKDAADRIRRGKAASNLSTTASSSNSSLVGWELPDSKPKPAAEPADVKSLVVWHVLL